MDSVSTWFDKLKGLFGGQAASPPAPVTVTAPPVVASPLITALHLEQIYGCDHALAQSWVLPIDATLRRYAINTPKRIAAFLAQVGHESGRLRHVRELWGPTDAQARYEGRADLGNVQPGDGFRFRGRGLIQITGRHNYGQVAAALQLDCVNRPELLEQPYPAALTAGWYWNRHNLNDLADAGLFDDITRRINGGQNGKADRRALYSRALLVLQ